MASILLCSNRYLTSTYNYLLIGLSTNFQNRINPSPPKICPRTSTASPDCRPFPPHRIPYASFFKREGRVHWQKFWAKKTREGGLDGDRLGPGMEPDRSTICETVQLFCEPTTYQKSRFDTASALLSMNSRRGSTASPIRVLKIWSAPIASSMVTLSMRRTLGSIVVSHS